MPNKTWVGSASNSAADQTAWTPAGAPAAGDTLLMPTGTMNVTGADLAGDPVKLPDGGDSAAFNLSGSAAVLNLTLGNYGQQAAVNLADGTDWIGGFSTYPMGVVTVNGAGGRWSNTQTNVDGSTVIAPAVDGNGTITDFESHASGTVEFRQGVGSGQSVLISGYAEYGGDHGVVQVDQPNLYLANTTLGFGELRLQGLHADSYVLGNGTLTLFQNGSALSPVRLTVGAVNGWGPQGFGVSQEADAVVVHADGGYYAGGGKALPVFVTEPSTHPPGDTVNAGGATLPPPVNPPTSSPPPTQVGQSPPGSDQAAPPPASSGSSTTPTQTVSPPPSQSPVAPPPTTQTITNMTSTVVASGSSSGTTTQTSTSSTVSIGDGSAPTPLSPNEVSVVNLVAGLSPAAGGASAFLFDGGHLGADFEALGSGATGVDQTLTDMKQLLSAWVADPQLAIGVSVPGGPTLAIPGQFVVDVVNSGLKALVIGDQGLDRAYGGALSQFFAGAQQAMLGLPS